VSQAEGTASAGSGGHQPNLTAQTAYRLRWFSAQLAERLPGPATAHHQVRVRAVSSIATHTMPRFPAG
jgi:hypothetical protein